MNKKEHIQHLENRTSTAQQDIQELFQKVKQLETVLIKAGIIEDLDMTDVMYRKETIIDPWGVLYNETKRIPFVVNEAKLKA